ncbi:MAG TPA: hypothetical protein VD978_13790 [Azospirillum sp.]|nr:hypothetical protein [Azospirillum sp.]
MIFDDPLASRLKAVAAFHGLPDCERAERWAERLRMNRAEVERFATAPPAGAATMDVGGASLPVHTALASG